MGQTDDLLKLIKETLRRYSKLKKSIQAIKTNIEDKQRAHREFWEKMQEECAAKYHDYSEEELRKLCTKIDSEINQAEQNNYIIKDMFLANLKDEIMNGIRTLPPEKRWMVSPRKSKFSPYGYSCPYCGYQIGLRRDDNPFRTDFRKNIEEFFESFKSADISDWSIERQKEHKIAERELEKFIHDMELLDKKIKCSEAEYIELEEQLETIYELLNHALGYDDEQDKKCLECEQRWRRIAGYPIND